MKKYIALSLLMLMVTACSNNASQQPPTSQQSPATNAVDNNTTIDNTETNTTTDNTDTNGIDPTLDNNGISNNGLNTITENGGVSNIGGMNYTTTATVNATTDTAAAMTSETVENYYKMVGEEKAIEADIERLERDFAAKRIDANTLQSQKTALKQQENTLENQIDALENQIPISLPQNWVDTSNMEQMIQKLKEVENSEKQLERAIDQAELDYINNAITREDFIAKVIELEKQKDILDKQDDFLEDTLESLGWDD